LRSYHFFSTKFARFDRKALPRHPLARGSNAEDRSGLLFVISRSRAFSSFSNSLF
jgi:hypothetical protein